MALPEVRMSFPDRAALERELDQNLQHGRAFLQHASDVPVLSECVLVLIHPEHGHELRLSAQVVMVNPSGPMCGMGIALRGFGPEEIGRVRDFADSAPANDTTALQLIEEGPVDEENVRANRASESEPASRTLDETTTLPSITAEHADAELPAKHDASPEREDAAQLIEEGPVDDAPGAIATDTGCDASSPLMAADGTEPSDDERSTLDDDDDFSIDEERELEVAHGEHEVAHNEVAHGADDSDQEPARRVELQSGHRHEKLRHLNAAQQMKVARTGELAERIAVERLYGKQVWEALLHNPRLSIPEVARIARKGTVPKPLIELIIENGAWTKADAVRRALLSNPKLNADGVMKLLRITPKHELKMIEKGSAYAHSIRELARKLLKQ